MRNYGHFWNFWNFLDVLINVADNSVNFGNFSKISMLFVNIIWNASGIYPPPSWNVSISFGTMEVAGNGHQLFRDMKFF